MEKSMLKTESTFKSVSDELVSFAENQQKWSDQDLAHFQRIILEKLAAAESDVSAMQRQLENSREMASGDSAYSFHMADAGTDAMEREKKYLMLARQKKHIGYLRRALDRIEQGVYGICKVTGQKIQKERLEAVPHTQISIEAKRKQVVPKNNGRRH